MAKIVIVDKNDNVIGSAEKLDVLQKGLIRRIVRIFLFNSKGELFLQWRSKKMETYPETWDQSAGGHVDEGETYLQAAKRETSEELGIHVENFEEIGKCYLEDDYKGRKIKEFSMVYKIVYDGDISIDNDEVAKGMWFSLEEVDRLVDESPEKFPDAFIRIYKKYRNEVK